MFPFTAVLYPTNLSMDGNLGFLLYIPLYFLSYATPHYFSSPIFIFSHTVLPAMDGNVFHDMILITYCHFHFGTSLYV